MAFPPAFAIFTILFGSDSLQYWYINTPSSVPQNCELNIHEMGELLHVLCMYVHIVYFTYEIHRRSQIFLIFNLWLVLNN